MSIELQVMLQAIQQAGDVILNLQRHELAISRKQNNDLLTQADLEADALLKKYLLGSFPQYGWLSEETVDDPRRLSCDRIWIVDPIDGTKEYAQGLSEYAISVALIENTQPILAAVYNPARGQLFHAVANEGAWLNQEKITCSAHTNTILVSRSEYERGEWDHFQSRYVLKEMGSIAYKLALVASGHAAATITYQPRSEWDIAAGVLLVKEAKGYISNKQNVAFHFNQKEILVDGVIAKSGVSLEAL